MHAPVSSTHTYVNIPIMLSLNICMLSMSLAQMFSLLNCTFSSCEVHMLCFFPPPDATPTFQPHERPLNELNLVCEILKCAVRHQDQGPLLHIDYTGTSSHPQQLDLHPYKCSSIVVHLRLRKSHF